MREKILYYAYKYGGDYNKISKAVINEECYRKIDCNENYITLVDKDYPLILKSLRYPPWILFYKGDISLINGSCISVIGSRLPNDYGIKETVNLVRRNSDKIIVSGLAKGIDKVAHVSAICYKTKTIGVIACGLSYIYPYENKDLYFKLALNHLIISEYPYFVKPQRHYFPWRNRLIAAIGDVLYVTSATFKSGTMKTVDEALELSKEIWVLPYNIDEKSGEGCNYLISQGANVITNNT